MNDGVWTESERVEDETVSEEELHVSSAPVATGNHWSAVNA